MRRFLLVSLLLGFLWMGSSSFAADKLRISYSGTTTSNALLWVTKEARLFDKNGIDAEILYLAGSLGQTALIADLSRSWTAQGFLTRCNGSDERLHNR